MENNFKNEIIKIKILTTTVALDFKLQSNLTFLYFYKKVGYLNGKLNFLLK